MSRFFVHSILTKYLEPPTPGQKCGHISWKGGVSSSAHLSEIALQNINSGRDIHGPFSKNWVLTQVRETSYRLLTCFIYLSKLWVLKMILQKVLWSHYISTFSCVPFMALFLALYIYKSNKWNFVLFHERNLDLQNWRRSLLENSQAPPKV